MKYQKDFKKVSFGFGNEKVAGKGSLAEQHTPPEKNVDDKTALITVVLQVLIGVVAIAIKIFLGKKFFDKATKKKNKKEKKKAKKLAKKAAKRR
ncbi:MAG: hypothetical protein Q4A05_01205 [Ruminococcus sp.]|nr:hypothetical protein [Ruminococcus sp.]